MPKNIEDFTPATGRMRKEDSSVVNIADILERLELQGVDTTEIEALLTDIGTDIETMAGDIETMAERTTNPLTAAAATITRPNNTTAYAALDVIGTAVTSTLNFDTELDSGSGFVILGARLRIDVAAIPAGMTTFRVHLYNASPTAIADNAAYDLIAGDRTKYLGYITVPAMLDLGATIFALDDNLNFTGKLATGSTTLYAVIQTVGAWTPAALTVFSLTLNIAGV